MELKKYQKRVIADLVDYLQCLNAHASLSEAFRAFWDERQIAVGVNGFQGYQNVIDGVPHVCYKVPTGGGKTFLACASVKPIFDALPATRRKVVVWLVPSESILTQTLAALKNPHHPYRQRLNLEFGGRVEVYSKEELLSGQNFNPASVAEQLSVMVLSYDSFRARSKDGRKAYQANGNLASFQAVLGSPSQPIENADETALFQVINQLNPVVIVDESHHATSKLSVDMLKDFNPAFILDLTATPKKQANVISYVDALSLKSEQMVKLPVIAYNRSSQAEVITDAIDLQRSLELAATQAMAKGANYVRPIVLFQAQPKASEDATSFERLKEKLVATGIPEEQIAIKTASINELKGVNLLSEDCPIRFIITVNALKEGWDCPFAYILASLANKTSQVDVEQILGRVLRQPHARRHPELLLNMSYVLTSSNIFNDTLEKIIAGLNNAGFSRKDFRSVDAADMLPPPEETPAPTPLPAPPRSDSESGESEDFLNFDESSIASELSQREHDNQQASVPNPAVGLASAGDGIDTVSDPLRAMLTHAQNSGAAYDEAAQEASANVDSFVPTDLEDAVETCEMYFDFVEELQDVRVPQFVIQTPPSLLFAQVDGEHDLLTHEALAEGFSLKSKDTSLDLTAADEQMFRIDVDAKGDVPRAFRMSATDQRFMREHFAKLSFESQKNQAAGAIYERLKPINSINDSDLKAYIERVVDNFDSSDMLSYQEHPRAVAEKIRTKIYGLLNEHKVKTFYEWIETGRITTEPHFMFPPAIQPVHASSMIGGSLYRGEDRMNNYEMELATRFSAMENLRWWHRNIDRKGLCLNGHINHYPDFILMTENGVILLVEPKGEQLKNDDSRQKLKLGRTWAQNAGANFRYYMVFDDGVTPLEGAHTLSEFLHILEQL